MSFHGPVIIVGMGKPPLTDEMKEAIKEELKYDYAEVLEQAEDKEDVYKTLYEIFFTSDSITGSASGSYYFNSYESRKHCYNYSDDVKNALETFGYAEMLEKFQIFENACDYNYIDVENMEIDADTFDELDEYDKEDVVTALCPYTIGGDTAEEGEDYYTAKVINNLTDESVATLQVQFIDEDLYAEQMYCLGKYYHDALIGIEINYSRQPTRILQKKYNYPNLYMRERLDGASDRSVMDYGFETTSRTKPIIIGELVELMRNNPYIEEDIPTLKEMTTFVKKENGKLEAIDGCHDDLVMAKAIAHFISKKQTRTWIEVIPTDNEFISDNFNLGEAGGNEGFMSWEDF